MILNSVVDPDSSGSAKMVKYLIICHLCDQIFFSMTTKNSK
jgi:hypothetical protein